MGRALREHEPGAASFAESVLAKLAVHVREDVVIDDDDLSGLGPAEAVPTFEHGHAELRTPRLDFALPHSLRDGRSHHENRGMRRERGKRLNRLSKPHLIREKRAELRGEPLHAEPLEREEVEPLLFHLGIHSIRTLVRALEVTPKLSRVLFQARGKLGRDRDVEVGLAEALQDGGDLVEPGHVDSAARVVGRPFDARPIALEEVAAQETFRLHQRKNPFLRQLNAWRRRHRFLRPARHVVIDGSSDVKGFSHVPSVLSYMWFVHNLCARIHEDASASRFAKTIRSSSVSPKR